MAETASDAKRKLDELRTRLSSLTISQDVQSSFGARNRARVAGRMRARRHFDWRAMVIFVAVAAAAGYLGSLWLVIPLWVAACIAAAALLINGVVAIFEDWRKLND